MISLNISVLNGRPRQIWTWDDSHILSIKKVISIDQDPSPDQIMLSYRSRLLHNDQTLRDYDYIHGAKIEMLLRARWGGINGG